MSTLYVITGPAGVGKSTISKRLAKVLDKSALIEGDDIYHLIKSGYVSPWLDGNHLPLFWKNCLDMIDNTLSAGYDVVFNYIVQKGNLQDIKKRFKNHTIKFVVLLVDKETLLDRDSKRPKSCQMGERCLVLLQSFIKKGFEDKYILNTAALDVKQSVKTILEEDRFLVK